MLPPRRIRHDRIRDLVQQRLKKTTNLAVRCGPISPSMGINGLVQMAERNGEVKRSEQDMNLVISRWKMAMIRFSGRFR